MGLQDPRSRRYTVPARHHQQPMMTMRHEHYDLHLIIHFFPNSSGFDAASDAAVMAAAREDGDVSYTCFTLALPPPALSALHACLVCFLQHADCSKVRLSPFPRCIFVTICLGTASSVRRARTDLCVMRVAPQAAAAVVEQFVRGHLRDCLLVQIPLVCVDVILIPARYSPA